jgi:hypothetical protein
MRNLLLKCSRAIFNWPPMPAAFLEKSSLIARLARQYNTTNFVETGTFHGGMIEAQRGNFQNLFSIELNEHLFAAARAKFAGDSKIHLIQGDSGVRLREVAEALDQSALFWLDAHYSRGKTSGAGSDAPILRELSGLASRHRFNDLILIDDARLFGLKSDYPKLEAIRQFASQCWPRHTFAVESDIICILPPP